MEPRLFRRGDMSRWLGRCEKNSTFNGATPFQAWRLEGQTAPQKQLYRLQWSHAFSGVETLITWERSAGSCSFNGATPFQAWRQRP